MLELLDDVVDKTVVRVFASPKGMSMAVDLTSEMLSSIEHKDVMLALDLLVKTVGVSSRSELIDDTEHVRSANVLMPLVTVRWESFK